MASTLGERLGFAAEERIAVVHCDDIGMCHAANVGAFAALDAGPATSGSLMVPCPWFTEAAEMAAERPEVDLGVHLVLNSEFARYRWGPLAGASRVPSLVDSDGCFPRTAAEVVQRARPEEVEIELRVQVERALAAGIDVTHLDAHMGTALLPPFIEIYAKLARELRLPVFAVRPDEATLAVLGAEGTGRRYVELLEALEADGIPALDGFDANSLHFAEGQGEPHNRGRLAGLGRGVSYLICHPARAGDELSAISETAHMRDFERRFYGGDRGRRALDELGVRTLGMRPLRDLVRAGP
ncbi:MAG: polysaccharide deacetylase family protein [Myxococcota bacterium]|nr:polysaccharide deacetylase family protein [Myxococcota bacterium]